MDPNVYAKELAAFVRALEGANFDARLLLAEMAEAIQAGGTLPRTPPPEGERDYLVNYGGLGDKHEWAAEDTADEAGALHLLLLITRLEDLRDSWSVGEAALLLDTPEEDVAQRIEVGQFVAFTSAGTKRLPRWQFARADGDASRRPLPHLQVIAQHFSDENARRSARVQMTTRHEDLVMSEDEGALAPVDWLLRGGDPGSVIDILGHEQSW